MLWQNLREEEFEGAIERSGGLCVLPIGCLEKHGQHLPVGTDSYHNWTVCALAAEQEDGHVGFYETALMMGIVPQYCRIDKVEQESGLSTHQADYLSAWGVNSGTAWGYNYPNAYHGYAPVGVTETIGKTVLKVRVDRMCRLYKQIKEDENCVRMAQRLPLED